MKTALRILAVALCLLLSVHDALAAEEAGAVDWNRARELYQRSQRGEKLSADEQAYLDRAKAERNKRAQPNPALEGKPSTGLVPLTELAEKYKDQDGGLYGGGRNEPPAEHRAAAEKELAQIKPLDADGRPALEGKVVLLAVGMSNTTQEFSRFKQLADADEQKAPQVVIVDGAQGGQAAAQWASEDSRTWAEVERRLKAAGSGPKQVQVAWIKQAEIRPQGALQEHAGKLRDDLITILNLLKERYPNLRVAYLSSRIYGGYAATPLNPEPYAYEGAFAMRWVIQEQIGKNPKLNCDPRFGDVKAPLVLWGPYLWADGTTPRKSDGLVWERKDLGGDGTHPSDTGRQKVAELLLKFLKSDAWARTWFLKKQ